MPIEDPLQYVDYYNLVIHCVRELKKSLVGIDANP